MQSSSNKASVSATRVSSLVIDARVSSRFINDPSARIRGEFEHISYDSAVCRYFSWEAVRGRRAANLVLGTIYTVSIAAVGLLYWYNN